MKRADVIVVGTGITSLLTALKLHESGLQPLLISSETDYSEFPLPDMAILPPWQSGEWVDRLEKRSAELLPELVTGLGQATGVDCAINQVDLVIAGGPDEKATAWLTASDRRWREGTLAEFDHSLAMGQLPGLLIKDRIALCQQRLVRALSLYLRQSGVEIIDHDPVRRLDIAGNIVLGAELISGVVRRAEATVVAAAGRTGDLLFDSGLERIEGAGRRSAALVFAPTVAALRVLVWTEELWLLPLSDDRLLAGLVARNPSADNLNTATLLERVYHWLPGLGRHDLQQRGQLDTVGAHSRPSIGCYPGVRGLWINSHHEVYGPLVALAAAEFLVEQLAGGPAVAALAVRVVRNSMQHSG